LHASLRSAQHSAGPPEVSRGKPDDKGFHYSSTSCQSEAIIVPFFAARLRSMPGRAIAIPQLTHTFPARKTHGIYNILLSLPQGLISATFLHAISVGVAVFEWWVWDESSGREARLKPAPERKKARPVTTR